MTAAGRRLIQAADETLAFAAGKIDLTATRLREALSYDRKTGVFTWRKRADMSRAWNVRFAGKPAGTRCQCGSGLSYTAIRLGGRRFYAHRLAWLYEHGRWPAAHLDHSWSSYWESWRADIHLHGKQYFLGKFATVEQAHDAYVAAKKRLHTFSSSTRTF